VATDVGSARVLITGDVKAFAKEAEAKINAALARMRLDPVKVPVEVDDADLARTVVKARAAGKLIGKALNDAADDSGKSFSRNLENSGETAIKLFAKSLTGGLSAIPSLIGPALIVVGLGIVAGIAAVVGPALGAAIASAVLAAGGLGVIGLGAFLLKEEPALKAAATKLTESMKKVFTDAAQPILKPLIDALGVFQKLVVQIGPQVKEAFKDIGPAIVPFAAGLADLVKNSLPGFNLLIAAAAPFLKGMAAVLPGLGDDLGTFFELIAASGPDATIFFQDFVKGLGAVIVGLGKAIAFLSEAYVAVKTFLGGFGPGFFDRAVEALRGLVTDGLDFVVSHLPDLIAGFLEMKSAVLDAAVELALGIADALPTIIPNVIQSLVQVITAMVNGLVTAAPKIVAAAGELINGLVDGIVAALPILLPAVIQIVTTLVTGIIGLIPIIIAAGLRLVQGLIEGVLGALPALSIALISAIPKIVSALISAVPQLLLLGTNLLLAVVQGFANALPQLISTIQTQVIPALLSTLQTQGPALIEQGLLAVQQFMQGWVNNVGLIVTIITTQIIPAITKMFRDNPQFLQAGLDVFQSLLNAWSTNIGLLTTFITGTLIPQITAFLRDNPQVIDAAINIILTIIQAMADSLGLIVQFVSGVLIPIVVDTLVANAPQIAGAGAQLMAALIVAFTKAIPSLVGAVFKINAAVVSGLLSALGSMSSAGVSLMTRFGQSMTATGLNAAIKATNAVRGAIVGAFAGAGSWLVSAGRRIIDGLISGIQSGFDRVRGLLSRLTSLLPDWKGPASVDMNILRKSGQLVMQGFEEGLTDRRKMIQDTLADLTGDLPSFTAGPVRGGDGAALGNITITIAPGAILIQGQGEEAGEEAAEAILERLGQATLVR